MGKAQLRPTPASRWRKVRREGVVIPLPSGNAARIRPVALDVMLAGGQIPDILSPLAAKTLWTEIELDQIGNVMELATGMADLVNLVCRAAFVEPRIVDEPQGDDEVAIEDIDFHDRAAVFQLAIGPARDLELFRQRQAKCMAALHRGKDDEPAAE